MRTTEKKCSLKAPHSLREESPTFKAILLIRLHFRALARSKNAQGIKCYLHIKPKRKNVAKRFLLSTKHPLWPHRSGSVSGPGTWSCQFHSPVTLPSAMELSLWISMYLYNQPTSSGANIPFRKGRMVAAYTYTAKKRLVCQRYLPRSCKPFLLFCLP